MDVYQAQFADYAVAFGMSITRIAAAFAALPLFSRELIQPVVRNSLFAALAIITLVLPHEPLPIGLGIESALPLFAKELFIGLMLGLLSSGLLWAIEGAGMLIDGMSGASMAQLLDPVNGHQSTPMGTLLSRLTGLIFVTQGGLLIVVTAVLESYVIWPVASSLPPLGAGAIAVVIGEFARLLAMIVIIAGPVIVILYVVEAAMGLMNRFVPSLNIVVIAPAIKSLIAWGVLSLMIGQVMELMNDEFLGRNRDLLTRLRSLF